LGLRDETEASGNKLDVVMQLLIDLRAEARANKDWALSDKIRDDLAARGIVLKDGKDGSTYTVED
jgi:cysteinyl-tRNA synthetase